MKLSFQLKTTFGLFFFLLLFCSSIKAVTYVNEELKYSIEFPDNWIQIPKDVLDKTISAGAKKAGTNVPEFVAGFQVKSKYWLSFPYILIRHERGASATAKQISRSFNKDAEKHFDKMRAKEIYKNLETGKSAVDPEKKMVITLMEMDNPNVGRVRALMAFAPGARGIVQANFYSVKKDYETWFPQFDSILTSLKFEDGYEYDWLSVTGKKALEKGMVGLITGLLTALVIIIVGFSRMRIPLNPDTDSSLKPDSVPLESGHP